jgi:hypothetical protein
MHPFAVAAALVGIPDDYADYLEGEIHLGIF